MTGNPKKNIHGDLMGNGEVLNVPKFTPGSWCKSSPSERRVEDGDAVATVHV